MIIIIIKFCGKPECGQEEASEVLRQEAALNKSLVIANFAPLMHTFREGRGQVARDLEDTYRVQVNVLRKVEPDFLFYCVWVP